MKPTKIINGLAIYKIGKGEPVLVVPYPHAGTFVSIAEDAITTCIVAAGKSVLTFDPPESYHSMRKATTTMHEMVDCINETLNEFGISLPVDMVGHSMGSLCAIAFAISFPERINRLVLVGCTSGWRQQKKYGAHKSWKWWHNKQFWLSRYWGTKIYLGQSSLATYNKLNNIVTEASFVEKKYVQYFKVVKNDNKKPLPIRGKWIQHIRHNDYHSQLNQITCPVLICAGKYDIQTPIIMCFQINDALEKSSIVFFENSGHFPFIEEEEKFIHTIGSFLK